MKKIFFFIFCIIVISISSCVDSEKVNSSYYLTVNGLKVEDTDTTWIKINQLVQVQIFDTQENSFKAIFHSSNSPDPFSNGKVGSIKYETSGIYKVTVSLICDNATLSTYIKVDN